MVDKTAWEKAEEKLIAAEKEYNEAAPKANLERDLAHQAALATYRAAKAALDQQYHDTIDPLWEAMVAADKELQEFDRALRSYKHDNK